MSESTHWPDKANESHPQMTLFDGKSLNPIPQIKEAMRWALYESKLSRAQVADAMNELCRIHGVVMNSRSKLISVDMLEKWCALSAEHVIPLKFVPIFCEATKSIYLLSALAGSLDAKVINPEETKLLEWAKVDRKRKQLVKEQRKLEGQL
ncbi:hypothetical protein [Nitrospina gracilis]|uniref:hypothetical protein n=1 Tax=Nitrospina gracilis TaxID=35801 RepID=UPI001F43D415|nr:hypothetical protein [Nitrospina gracilis]MCF8719253.1 hypothetical protein [Nitrospina gracilis Nb-211]